MARGKLFKMLLAALLLLSCLVLTGCQESISSLVGRPVSEVSAMFGQSEPEDLGGLQIYRSDSIQLVFSSEDKVTGYAYYNTEGKFIRSAGIIPVERKTLLGFSALSELEKALCPPQCLLGEDQRPGYVTLDGLLISLTVENDQIIDRKAVRLTDGAEVSLDVQDE